MYTTSAKDQYKKTTKYKLKGNNFLVLGVLLYSKFTTTRHVDIFVLIILIAFIF
jgi:hypothetical protein